MKKFFFLLSVIIIGYLPNVHSQTTSFTSLFESLNSTLNVQYAFTEWKGINWNELYNEFQPRIAAAETADDTSAFYLAIREYLYRIPDGHVSLFNFTSTVTRWGAIKDELMYSQIGGSYGFALIGLDDGRVAVSHITENSPADSAGIKFGAEIIEINDLSIEQALENVSILWSENIPATQEGKRLQQYRFIGRAPVGNSMQIKFRNRNSSETVATTLHATDDEFYTYHLTTMSTSRDTLPPVTYEISEPGGFGYIQLTSCGSPAMIFEIYNKFKNAIQLFVDNDVPGIILDLRLNEGGEDNLAAALAGFFYKDTTHYESVSFFNPDEGEFTIMPFPVEHLNSKTNEAYINPDYPLGTIFIEPADLHYGGPVVVLSGPRNISSGEGVAMALQKLPNCEVVSLYGSQGSFGIIIPDFAVWLDANRDNPLVVMYPFARSLDENYIIQLDSDVNMIGGVIPDIRPPLNDDGINKMFMQNIDYELEYAVQHLSALVSVEEKDQINIPNEFVLSQNYPNPFNPATRIKYSIPSVVDEKFSSTTTVTLRIFDILGREIKTLVNQPQSPGNYELEFNASALTSGMYIYKLISGSFVQSRKMLLIK